MEQFLSIIDKLKAAFDRPAITTDIIVGFPGETEEDFRQTAEICRQIGFAKIHVFSFSPRKNTAAVKLAKIFGSVTPQEIKRRSTILQQIDKQLQADFREKCRGLHEQVLVENIHSPRGRCSRYFMVDLKGHPNVSNMKKGEIVKVQIT